MSRVPSQQTNKRMNYHLLFNSSTTYSDKMRLFRVVCKLSSAGFAGHKSGLQRLAIRSASMNHSKEEVPISSHTVPTALRMIETELRREAEQSYLAYAMSVIVGRAIPDARDGLKPVHRRILYAMNELGLDHSKPFRKCARVVGEVLGKFHPHGDSAVYDALVRMAQSFSMRAPLIEGHGNFGSLDDDPPAAMRYTECRLEPLTTSALLSDLDAGTVDFVPNFDASTMEPAVLPAKFPNLLVNGSSGIAVGIATKIPPHNMFEVVAALKALIRDPGITSLGLMDHLSGPDFPTGGELVAGDSLRDVYQEGKGVLTIRAKIHFEENARKRSLIVITELPYQSSKAALVEQIAKLVDEGKITGVSDVRDESDRSGVRIAIELKKGSEEKLVLNQLYKFTSVQTKFACNMIALKDGLPKTLSLKDFLETFLKFRYEVVEKRAKFQLAKALKRLHLVEGFLIVTSKLDFAVQTIREAQDSTDAIERLKETLKLSDEQATGVMNLTLRRLTSLEIGKIKSERDQLTESISDLRDLLERKERILGEILREAEEVAKEHGTPRRTALVPESSVTGEVRKIDVIENSQSIIVYSRKGYIKRMSAEAFAVQSVRGIGKVGTRLKDEDTVEDVIYVNAHDRLLFFTTEGQVHALDAYEIPESSRMAVGTAITQMIKMKPSSFAAILPVSKFNEDFDVIMLTSGGHIKRSKLSQFMKVSAKGVAAISLREDDTLKFVSTCSETDSLLLTSSEGLALHFPVKLLRVQGRTAQGVKTMDAGSGKLVGMSVLSRQLASESKVINYNGDALPEKEPELFLLSKKGLGKKVPISMFRLLSGRHGKGVIAIKLNDGDELAAAVVLDGSVSSVDLLISSLNGMLLRVPSSQVATSSRSARGNRIVRLKSGDEVATATCINA